MLSPLPDWGLGVICLTSTNSDAIIEEEEMYLGDSQGIFKHRNIYNSQERKVLL